MLLKNIRHPPRYMKYRKYEDGNKNNKQTNNNSTGRSKQQARERSSLRRKLGTNTVKDSASGPGTSESNSSRRMCKVI